MTIRLRDAMIQWGPELDVGSYKDMSFEDMVKDAAETIRDYKISGDANRITIKHLKRLLSLLLVNDVDDGCLCDGCVLKYADELLKKGHE